MIRKAIWNYWQKNTKALIIEGFLFCDFLIA